MFRKDKLNLVKAPQKFHETRSSQASTITNRCAKPCLDTGFLNWRGFGQKQPHMSRISYVWLLVVKMSRPSVYHVWHLTCVMCLVLMAGFRSQNLLDTKSKMGISHEGLHARLDCVPQSWWETVQLDAGLSWLVPLFTGCLIIAHHVIIYHAYFPVWGPIFNLFRPESKLVNKMQF